MNKLSTIDKTFLRKQVKQQAYNYAQMYKFAMKHGNRQSQLRYLELTKRAVNVFNQMVKFGIYPTSGVIG